MRVLVIAQDFPSERLPGLGIVVLRQARALARLGHELLVIRLVPHAPPFNDRWKTYRAILDNEIVEGIPVQTIRALFPPRMIALEYLHLQLDRRIERVSRQFLPELIHAHYVLPCGHLAVQQRLPTVVTAHGSDAYDWAWRRAGLRRAAAETIRKTGALVAVSDFIRQRLRDIHRRHVEVIYNGADEVTFLPQERNAARVALGIPSDRFVIAFAGAITTDKGAFDLLRAAERMQEVRPLVLLAGSSQEGADVGGAFDADARLLGQLPHEQLARVFAAADVVTLPSYHEGLPLVLCEAMLMGRPVLATTVGGIPEIVEHGTTGYLVSPGDIDGLTQRLSDLAGNEMHRGRMANAARAFALRNLTWSLNARRYEELYRRVLLPGGATETCWERTPHAVG